MLAFAWLVFIKLFGKEYDNVMLAVGGIGFGMGHLYDKVNSGGFFDICYTLQENEFMGKNDIQMIVKDIRLREE